MFQLRVVRIFIDIIRSISGVNMKSCSIRTEEPILIDDSEVVHSDCVSSIYFVCENPSLIVIRLLG